MVRTYDELPAVMNAELVAQTLGISRTGAYQLMHRADFPTLRIGKRMLVTKDKLIHWIDQNSDGSLAG